MPENPFMLLAAIGVDCGQRGIDDGPVRLQGTCTGVDGEIVKSLKLKDTVAECESVLLVPVIVTLNVPAPVEVHDSVAVCGEKPKNMLFGDTLQVRGAPNVGARRTFPLNPLSAVTVTVDVAAVVPSAGAAPGADALIAKSTTWKRMDPVEWLSVPLTPVTTTL
jgi:hypothetical protein